MNFEKAIEEIYQAMHKVSAEKLISEFKQVLSGSIKAFIPGVENPEYYEVWFYSLYDFQYTVVGWENYSFSIQTKEIEDTIQSVLGPSIHDAFNTGQLLELQVKTEFRFVSDCWEEAKRDLNPQARGFFIEHVILRGWDMDRRTLIDADDIERTLEQEGIKYHQ